MSKIKICCSETCNSCDSRESGRCDGLFVEQKTGSEHIEDVFEMMKNTFTEKQAEYKGQSGDVFRNFNQGAQLQGESPEQTLLGYVDKQVVSLFDAKHTNPKRLSDPDFVIEKAKDIAVYMIILMAMVRSKTNEIK